MVYVPAASGPPCTEGTPVLAAGLGGLVVGVGARLGAAGLGAAKLGEADPPPDGCPVEQPVMENQAIATTAADLPFMSTLVLTGSWVCTR
jgi:hypothetical protein